MPEDPETLPLPPGGDRSWPLWRVDDTDSLVRYLTPDDVLIDDELKVDTRDFAAGVRELFSALERRMIGFREEPLESIAGYQAIRPPRTVLAQRAGNCLDLSLLLASAGHAQQLHTHIVLLDPDQRINRHPEWSSRSDVGHAMVAFAQSAQDDLSTLWDFVPASVLVVDVERVTVGASFEGATGSADRILREAGPERIRVVDVTAGIQRVGSDNLNRPPTTMAVIGTYVPPPPLGYVPMDDRVAAVSAALDGAADRWVVIHGEAGSGKSVVARAALMQQRDLDRLFLTASDLPTLKRSMATVQRRRLQLPPMLEGLVAEEIDAFAVSLRKALHDSALPWTVVLDNLDQPQENEVLAWFQPPRREHRVIITTNHAAWAEWQGAVRLGPLQAGPAVDFLAYSAPDVPRETLRELAAAAGNLPVALHHVAGALARGLAPETALAVDRSPGRGERTAWTAWSTRVAARSLSPEAWMFVSQLAYLAPEGIRLADLPSGSVGEETIAELEDSRLLRHQPTTGFWMHRNTAAAIRLHAHDGAPRRLAELLDHEPLLERLRVVGERGEQGLVPVLAESVPAACDPARRPIVLVRLATLAELLAGFRESGDMHRQALDLWQREVPVGQELIFADALHGEARLLNRDRDDFSRYGQSSVVATLEVARASTERARALREVHGGDDVPALLARSDAMLGLIHLSWANVDPATRAHHRQLAKETLERSLDTRRELGAQVAPLELARGIYNLGALYLDLLGESTDDEEKRTRLAQAEDAYRESLVRRRVEYGADARNAQIAASLRGLGEVALHRSRLPGAQREPILAAGAQDAAAALTMRLELGGDPSGLRKARETVIELARELVDATGALLAETT